MEELMLPVQYRGEEREFGARIAATGYTYKLLITVDQTDITFEKDEEGQFRAVLATPERPGHLPDPELVQAITEQLNRLLT